MVQFLSYVDHNMSNLPLVIVHNVLNQVTKELKARGHLAYEQLKQLKTKVTNLEEESVVIVE